MATRREYISTDPGSQENKEQYEDLLHSIERRMDPKSNTVLIVDDSKMVRKMVMRDIASKDSRIVAYQAENGREALERLAEIRESYERDPVFIVLDLEMPVMDGWELLTHLRKDYEKRGLSAGIPVIVLSSSSGIKGSLVFRKSVHGSKARYNPMVTVAKQECLKPGKYDAKGEKGLSSWLKHFLRSGSGR